MSPPAITERVDHVFGERYRAETLIGTGASTAVYAARDRETGRRVALKIFDESTIADGRFGERLLAAADRARGLDHPNIAKILDVGLEPEPYLVSELCEGGSLASLLDAGHRLNPSQALVMALECARALHHGHGSDEVHRRLKPENILFSADQRVRLTDYAMADVVGQNATSHTQDMLQEVRYASPEQARGRPVSDRSDLYSLSLVVSEAVSGNEPAVAETVVGTLMARAESAAVLDAELAGLLPAMERCGRVAADERPEAEELTIALLAAAETMPRPAAFPLIGMTEDETDFLGPDATDDLRAVDDLRSVGDFGDDLMEAEASETIDLVDDEFDHGAIVRDDVEVPGAAEPVGLEDLGRVEPVFAGSAVERELDVPVSTRPAGSTRAAYQSQDEDDAEDPLPWWPLAVLGVLVALACAGGWLLYQAVTDNGSASVPELAGMQYAEVEALAVENGWQLNRLELRSNGSVPGVVLAQDPVAGSRLDEGEALTATVSLGDEMVEIPSDIVGLTVEQATARLSQVGLGLGSIVEENNEALPGGLVIGLNEPTTQKPAGQGVALRVSLGPEQRVVPTAIIGLDRIEAAELLVALRLQPIEEAVFDDVAAEGTVLGSMPGPGDLVEADAPITLFVSAGPAPVEIPDIEGLTLAEARDALTELGLISVDVEGTPGEDALGTEPPAGEMVEVGSEVVIILGDPDEDDEEADQG